MYIENRSRPIDPKLVIKSACCNRIYNERKLVATEKRKDKFLKIDDGWIFITDLSKVIFKSLVTKDWNVFCKFFNFKSEILAYKNVY